MRRSLLLALIAVAVAGLAACAGAGPEPGSRPGPSSPAPDRTGTSPGGSFVSLWPACACGRRTVLDQFSLTTGRRMRELASVSVAQGENLATPGVDREGRVWLTYASGPRCTSNVAGCGPEPNSCAGHVQRIDPGTPTSITVLSFPRSVQVTDALPSPDGHQAALVEGGCVRAFFDQHLVIRDLSSGREWPIGEDAAACHALGTPGWSPNGRRLVFAYGPSGLRRGAHPAPGTCTAPRSNRLVIVSAQRASTASSWKLVKAQRGCSYQVATFDPGGVAATESCGARAYLVQLSHRERVIRRVALEPGWEEGEISTEPGGIVLVSQDQPANSGYPERDWVWQFNGRTLRLVSSYKADDAAQVIAVPAAAP